MKGYFSIEIPTKKYIKAYIHSQLGEPPIITTKRLIGNKFYDLLDRNKEQWPDPSSLKYNATIKLYITNHTFCHRGGDISLVNLKAFNLFVEEDIKRKYRELMDIMIEMRPSFEANLAEVRERIGIDFEAWDTESIKKDYYRHRKRKGLPLLYKK